MRIVLALLLMLVAWPSAAAEIRSIDGGDLGEVKVFVPPGPATGFAFVLSDQDGWTAAMAGAAQRLAETGVIAAGIDTSRYLQSLDRAEGECFYVVGALEDLSRRIQRTLDRGPYQTPILAGNGVGGALAYAALAQSPPATIAGALSIDFTPALPARQPPCPDVDLERLPAGGGFRLKPAEALEGWWHVAWTGRLAADPSFVRAVEDADIVDVRPGTPPEDALATLALDAIREATAQPGRAATIADELPIVESPAERPGPLLAVIYSGDGGWRDIDRQIGQVLSEQGVSVIGVDALRYFWSQKSPEIAAHDLDRILTFYRSHWDRPEVILVGYSFGADVLPAMFNRLSDRSRRSIVLISLLGLSETADFEIHVSDWLGEDPGEDAVPVRPDLARIDPKLIQCIYGVEEEDTLCTDPLLHGAEVIQRPGGHHFDGDYHALAEAILRSSQRRSQAAR